MIKGKIHSVESMGLVDGPGIRVVVFMQGCTLRCLYCHNPDTWTLDGNKDALDFTPEELVNKISRFRSYFEKSGGGVTFSGGDPLKQPEFLKETLKLCKEAGIHTTLDTSGVGFGDYEEILKYTDLVLYDVKHLTREGYKDMTGIEIDETQKFLEACKKMGTKMWIRQVVVPGKTDSEEYIRELGKFIKTLDNVEKVELLPYHLLGVNKYETLGIKYRLEGLKAMDKEACKALYKFLEL
ncbi:pyruvate formate-lyase-activating protein [uncultured Clostridium sp.]|uniref:pyruvate formate-lyase-activating protein n=1 Tax=uncultured Clostridium sp. TaxID=59620 RepID=UPI002671CA61|nr:pyruvate formate-lyase-activating protein [uncultured Clostridium sp.]